MSQVTDIIHSASEPPVLNQVVDPRFHTVAEFSDLHSPRAESNVHPIFAGLLGQFSPMVPRGPVIVDRVTQAPLLRYFVVDIWLNKQRRELIAVKSACSFDVIDRATDALANHRGELAETFGIKVLSESDLVRGIHNAEYRAIAAAKIKEREPDITGQALDDYVFAEMHRWQNTRG